MKIILIFTDSIALPRKGGALCWDQIYISKLKNEFNDYEIINISIGGASIMDLRNQVNYYKVLSPEIVILHCGIVDAAPRAFGRIEIELIKKLKIFRFTKFLVPVLRKHRSHHYAKPKKFLKLLMEMKIQLDAKRFLAIGIIPAMQGYEKVLPGITSSIKIYNEILKSQTEFISLEHFSNDMILKDFHHINRIGQEYIFNQIVLAINKKKQIDS